MAAPFASVKSAVCERGERRLSGLFSAAGSRMRAQAGVQRKTTALATRRRSGQPPPFVHACVDPCSHMRTCRFAFFLFDLDESGFLDMNEVESMVASVYGAHFADDERVKRVLDCLDANGDGEVSLSEWILFNKKYPMLLFPAYQLQEKLREKVIGKWWWDVMQFNRNEHFKNANVSTARTLENGRAHTPRAAERERRSECPCSCACSPAFSNALCY